MIPRGWATSKAADATVADAVAFARLRPMERLQQLGVLIAFMTLGVVVVSLYGGFQTAIAQPIALILGIIMGGLMIAILLRVALVPERRYTGWVRKVTNRNGRYLFAVLLLLWIAAMAFLASLNLPAQKVGAPALVGHPKGGCPGAGRALRGLLHLHGLHLVRHQRVTRCTSMDRVSSSTR